MADKVQAPFNQHGGLTLVPLPGSEDDAREIAERIEARRNPGHHHYTPVDIAIPTFGTFRNGESDVQLGKQHVGGHDCVIIDTSGPGTDERIMRKLWALNFLAARRASRVVLVNGYFPLSRSDKDEGDLRLTTPPMLVRMMKAAATLPSGECVLDRIICADPHSPQVAMAGGSGFITPIILSRRLLQFIVEDAQATGRRVCLAFPDDSAYKRFGKAIIKVENDLGIKLPRVVAIKRRDIVTGKSELVDVFGDVDALPGSIVVMLDDEIDTGGSTLDMATFLRERFHAAVVWAGVTHPVLSKPENFTADDCPVDRILAMNTIATSSRPELSSLLDSGRLLIHSWNDDLAQIIFYHHWNMNVREAR